MRRRGLSQPGILVTGAGGFVGGAVARGLQATSEYNIIGVSRKATPDLETCGIRVLQCDLERGFSFDEPLDFIIHCAAVQDFELLPVKDFIEANLAITENIARFGKSAGVKGVIYASSVTLHGDIRGGKLDELSDRVNPSVFGVSKCLCETILRNYAAYFPTIALRLCGVVGPDAGATRTWLSKVKSQAICGEDITIVNADKPFNNLVHADDLLRFIRLLIKVGFSGFNAFPIASREPITISEVVGAVVEGIGSSSRIIDKGPSENSFIISNDFATKRFGYEPLTVRDNLRKFAVSTVCSESR